MKIAKIILHMILKVLYVFACLQPVKKQRVTFITLTSESLNGDFALISKYLKHKDSTVELKYILTRFRKSIIGDLQYFFNCLYQIFLVNSSHVVILNDNNYVISNFKRKDVKVIQIWHACGAVKRFGNEIDRQYPIQNYDYVLSGSKAWSEIYSRSFGVSEAQVVPLGIARTDVLNNRKWLERASDQLREKYPVVKDKYVILYVPTFRGNIIEGLSYEALKLEHLLVALPDDVVILYRMHPLLKNVSLGYNDRIINVAEDDLNKLYSVADCLVTDYSSVVFDFSIMNKKMVLYVPDLEEYEHERGLNISLQDIPAEICTDEEMLADALKNRMFSQKEIVAFRKKYATSLDGKSTKRIGDFILNIIRQ